MQFDLFEIKHQCCLSKYTDSNALKFKKKRGLGGAIFSIKWEGLLIGGGYFLKREVSLIFILTSPFQY